MIHARLSFEQVWQIDDEALLSEFAAEWGEAQARGQTRTDFIRESASILTDGWQRQRHGCKLVSDPYPDVDWES